MEIDSYTVSELFFLGCGIVGGLLFFGRFYVQWIVSELRGEYTIPVAFWYMSGLGALLLFVYAYGRESPGGTFGLCFNMLVYARNLIYVWKEKGTLTRAWSYAAHGIAFAVMIIAIVATALTWQRGYTNTTEFWLWSAIWVVGQGVFFSRFIVQWGMTEIQGKSVVPALFWHLSLIGMVLHGSYFIHRADWIIALGTFADGVPYARNLWLMRRERRSATSDDSTA